MDGWLPTLDVSLKVHKDNSVQFKFFEKDTCSRKTVHKDSAMEIIIIQKEVFKVIVFVSLSNNVK